MATKTRTTTTTTSKTTASAQPQQRWQQRQWQARKQWPQSPQSHFFEDSPVNKLQPCGIGWHGPEQVPGIFRQTIFFSKWSKSTKKPWNTQGKNKWMFQIYLGSTWVSFLHPGQKADSGGKDHPGWFQVVIVVVLPRMVVPHEFNIFWRMFLSFRHRKVLLAVSWDDFE